MLSTIRDALLPAAARAIRRPVAGDPRRILVVQPDHLGDIILSEPALRLLRNRLPDYELVAVVGPWSEEIARLAWPVDRIVTVAFPGFERATHRRKPLDPYSRLSHEARRLGELNAAHAVVLRDDAWWAAWLAMLSTSGEVAAANHPRTAPFATLPVCLADIPHRSAQSLELVARLLGCVDPSLDDKGLIHGWDMSPGMDVPPNAPRLARAILDEREISSPYIVVHPGAGADVKCWPERSWRAVLDELAPRPIVITGGDAERAMCERLSDGFEHVKNLAGDTSLEALTGLLHGASAVIGTDNGPVHLAAAVRTPTVRIFGPSSAERYGPPPGASGHIVLDAGWTCPRCEDIGPSRPAGCGCMAAVTPSMVLETVRKILNDGA